MTRIAVPLDALVVLLETSMQDWIDVQGMEDEQERSDTLLRAITATLGAWAEVDDHEAASFLDDQDRWFGILRPAIDDLLDSIGAPK